MARDLFTNQASTTVAASKTAPAAGTTESWTVASSSAFPAASNSTYPTTQFYVADPAAPTELILVTNVSGTTWDVTRGADGTTPVTHSSGFTIKNVVPSAFLQNLADRLQQETFSVKDFGAKGDNANADHVGIQAALDTAYRAGGGQVIVPKGIYRVMGGTGALRIRSNVRLTMLPGAEIHRYNDSSSLVWNGDGIQVRGGWTGHGNITIDGGVWDMRCSTATHGCTTVSVGGTTAPVAGTTETLTVANNNGQPNLSWPNSFPFYIYDPATPSEIMAVTAATTTSLSVTRGALSTTPVAHTAGWTARNASMVLANDTFTRSNTSAPHTLGVMDTGQTWIDEQNRGTGDQGNGCLGITSNTAYAPSALSVGSMNTVFAWPDGSVSCTIPTVGSSGFAGLVFRVASSQQYWQYVRDNTTGNAKLSYFTTTGLSINETVVTPTATTAVSAGATLRVVFYGNNIKCYVGTTLTHDTTDTPGYTHHRKVGLIISDTVSRIDSFESTASIWEDTFTRANSTTTPGSATSAPMAWTEQAGNLGIASSAIYAPGAGTNIATLPATQETNPEAIMTTAGNAGLVFRFKDTNNYWAFERHTDGNARLIKVVNGSTTVQTASVTQAVPSGSLLRVCTNGYSVRAYVGSVRTHDINDSDHYQEKNVGVVIYDTTARLDNFKAVTAWGGSTSGACLNFGHSEQILIRDTVIRDNSANSHAVEIAGCKNVLTDNVTFQGMAYIHGRFSEAFQMDLTKSGSYFGSFGPHDNTTNRDVVLRGCSFIPSNMPGTSPWQRGIGSHSGTVDCWHDHLRITDCFFEVTQKAVRAFNWNNVLIRGNTIRTGEGIEVRVIDPDTLSDTINNAGVTTSASQAINNIQVEGNIITVDRSPVSTVYAIHLIGVSSGLINGSSVLNNDIKATTCGGIGIDWCNGIAVSNNLVNSNMLADSGSAHGIRLYSTTDAIVANNSVYRTNANGIYLTAQTSGDTKRIRIMNNYVRGANRVGGANSCIKADSSPDDISVLSNVTKLWGSGSDPQYSLHVTSGTNISHFGNDFAVGTTDDFNIPAAGEVGPIITRRATATTSIGTTSTAITGLSMTLPVGNWKFEAWVPIINATSNPTNMIATMAGPTVSQLSYSTMVVGSASTSHIRTTFGASASTTAGTTTTGYIVQIIGTCTVTTAGTLSVACTRTGGTTSTAQIGSYLRAERLF